MSHPNGACGNVGCLRCNPLSFRPWLVDGKPHRMPHKYYLKWIEAGRPRQ